MQCTRKQFAGVESKKTYNLCKARENMQVTVAKCEKTFNLCKVQESRSLVSNVLTRENIEAVQIVC